MKFLYVIIFLLIIFFDFKFRKWICYEFNISNFKCLLLIINVKFEFMSLNVVIEIKKWIVKEKN